jgi:hypothetical protein
MSRGVGRDGGLAQADADLVRRPVVLAHPLWNVDCTFEHHQGFLRWRNEVTPTGGRLALCPSAA